MVVLYKLMYEAFGNDRFTEKVEGEILADLIIDKGYYNTLDIEGFSKMMNSPSYCYKFYWLEAIVQLIAGKPVEFCGRRADFAVKAVQGRRLHH